MLRHLCTLMLICCFFITSALAAPPSPEQLASISQWDEAFHDRAHRYRGYAFRGNGCAPSSLTNGLICALGVTDKAVGKSLVLDMLNLLTDNDPETPDKIVSNQLERLVALPTPEKYPALRSLLSAWGGHLTFTREHFTQDHLTALLPEPLDTNCLAIAAFAKDDRWELLCSTAHTLYHTGHQDAVITLGMLGAGTIRITGAFRSGRAGHYVTLYVPVREFCESGTVYLIDSLPRAIAGEDYGLDLLYRSAYDFDSRVKGHREFHKFIAAWQVERVQPTILRLTPAEPLGRDALSLQDAPNASADRYKTLLNTMGLRGQSYLFLHIPAR